MYYNLTPMIRLWNIKNKNWYTSKIKRSFYSIFSFSSFSVTNKLRIPFWTILIMQNNFSSISTTNKDRNTVRNKKFMWHEKLDPHEPILQIVAFSETEKQRNKCNAKIKFTYIYIVKLGTKSEFYVQTSCMLPEKLWLFIFI